MTQPVPAPQFQVLTSRGLFTTSWFLYLQQFGAQPAGIAAVTVGASPFAYTAPGGGTVNVSGGTVSLVQLTRGGVTITANTPVVVAGNDVVTVTYSGLPTVNFIPG